MPAKRDWVCVSARTRGTVGGRERVRERVRNSKGKGGLKEWKDVQI